MAIRNEQYFTGGAGFDGLFDWDFLKGAFGPVIQPTDIDGCVERNGFHLAFETKLPGVEVKTGQRLTLLSLVRSGWWTVCLLWGKTPQTIQASEWWYPAKDGLWKIEQIPSTAASVFFLAEHWFRLADQRKPFVPPLGCIPQRLAEGFPQRPVFWWE